MQEEFKKLFDLFHQSQKGKPVDLSEILKESIDFFEKLKETFKNGSEDEKKEVLQSMNEMYKTLMDQTKVLCERTGLSEEQLFAYCDNPSNFSKEQWEVMQEAKDKLFASGRSVSDTIQKKESPPSSKGGESKKVHKPKKDTWIRS